MKCSRLASTKPSCLDTFPRMTCLSFGRHVIFRHRRKRERERERKRQNSTILYERVDSIRFETFPEFSRPVLVSRSGVKERNSIPRSLRSNRSVTDLWSSGRDIKILLFFFLSFLPSFLPSFFLDRSQGESAIENYTGRYRRNIFNFVGGRLFQESGKRRGSGHGCVGSAGHVVFRATYPHSRSDNARFHRANFFEKSHKARHQGANINRIHRAMRQPGERIPAGDIEPIHRRTLQNSYREVALRIDRLFETCSCQPASQPDSLHPFFRFVFFASSFYSSRSFFSSLFPLWVIPVRREHARRHRATSTFFSP